MSIPTRVRTHFHLALGLKASAGLCAALRWEVLRLAVKLGFPEPAVWRIRPREISHALKVRLRGSSDLIVFNQVFACRQYSSARELQEPSLIIDLGANVGYSAAYFLSVFPRARVVAVEPDEHNLEICMGNLSPYGDRVLLLPGAVWSRRTSLRLLKGGFGDGLEWATQVDETIENDKATPRVQAWDVGSIIDMSGLGTVDLLKVDIERAELSVFGEGAGTWLRKVRNIFIELHGSDCEEVFFSALKDFNYDLKRFDELTICRNLRPKDES